MASTPQEIPKDQISVAKHLFIAITQFVSLDPLFKYRPIYSSGESYEGKYVLIENQAVKVFESLETNELLSGRCQNQKSTLKRLGESLWSSHYNNLISLVIMFFSVIEVLDLVMKNPKFEQKGEVGRFLDLLESFDMIFYILLMKNIL